MGEAFVDHTSLCSGDEAVPLASEWTNAVGAAAADDNCLCMESIGVFVVAGKAAADEPAAISLSVACTNVVVGSASGTLCAIVANVFLRREILFL